MIDQAAAAERNIAVRSAPGQTQRRWRNTPWALILACAKSVVSLDTRLREGHWDKATHKSIELEGQTLGLIGLGAIGSRVANMGHVFGMRVLAYDPRCCR